VITLADSDAERQEVLDFFLETFDNIPNDAVPMTAFDHMYEPLVLQVRDDEGVLAAGALTCRPEVAANSSLLPVSMRPAGMARVVHLVSQLDLIAVRPDRQGGGLGASMIEFMEADLVARGVRAWFGQTTPDLDVDRLRPFYSRMGFAVLSKGEELPPLLGQHWVPQGTKPAGFYFWKRPSAAKLGPDHTRAI
jgi:GNAT superfamily N-acetyltransferase